MLPGDPTHGGVERRRTGPYIYIYTYMSGEQNYLLIGMDMAKVGGPLSVVKACTSMLCKNRVSVSGRSPIRCEGFHTNLNIPSPLLTTFIVR